MHSPEADTWPSAADMRDGGSGPLDQADGATRIREYLLSRPGSHTAAASRLYLPHRAHELFAGEREWPTRPRESLVSGDEGARVRERKLNYAEH
jgi:hypothetical protein